MCSPTYRILAVDDLLDNLFLLQVILESEGYEVEIANCGRAALEKIDTWVPNLVLLDIMMPDLNGYEVSKLIRQKPNCADIPILLITAHSEIVTKILDISIDGFIRKPIDCDDLIQRIKERLVIHQTENKNERRARVHNQQFSQNPQLKELTRSHA